MADGHITQIIGAVIDVEFPRESIPHIYEALKLEDVELTLEVQQQLGDGVVRIQDGDKALFEEEMQIGIGLFFVAVVEDDFDMDAAELGIDEGLGDGLGGEGISEDLDLMTGVAELSNDGLGASALG